MSHHYSSSAPTHGDGSDWPVSYFNEPKQQLWVKNCFSFGFCAVLPFRRILRNIFIFRFRVRKQTSKKRPDRWIFWNSAGIDRIETNRIVMQDSGQANQNAEQAKPRTTNQLDYIKKVVFKSVAKHKHAWPFQVKRKSRIINLHKLHFV